MTNTIPTFTKAAFNLNEAHQVEARLRAKLRVWAEQVTVNMRDPFEITAALPTDLREKLLNASRADAHHGFGSYGSLFAFTASVAHRHHASGAYAKYLLDVDRQLWLLVKLAIEFNRLVAGEEVIALSVAQRALLLGAAGKLSRVA